MSPNNNFTKRELFKMVLDSYKESKDKCWKRVKCLEKDRKWLITGWIVTTLAFASIEFTGVIP